MNELIPFHRPYPLSISDKREIQTRLYEILSTGQLTNGQYVRKLEEKIKEMYNVSYCIVTANATQAINICLHFFHWIRPLHLPTFTWKSMDYILPKEDLVFYHDINLKTWLMENDFRGGLVLGVHTFGNVLEIENKFRNCIIYDGAHALGCKLKNIGDATVFSLAATKIITSCEGSIIITNNKKLAEMAMEWRDKICRMSEIHAIIGLQLLPHLKEVMEFKKKCFEYYSKNISGQFQEIPIESNYNTIGFLNTEKLTIPKEIEIKQYYEPLKKGFPNSEYIYQNIICLPSYYNCNYKLIVEKINEVNR